VSKPSIVGGKYGVIRPIINGPVPQYKWRCPNKECRWVVLARCGKHTKTITCIFCRQTFKVKEMWQMKKCPFLEKVK
jgi:hypothetical protein